MTEPVEPGVDPQPRKRFAAKPLLLWGIGITVSVGFLTLISSLIWPGQAVYLAPVFCEQPGHDAVVVSDTYSTGDGRSTNFTLYCVGERGQTTDKGWLQPFLLMWAAYLVVVTVVVSVVLIAAKGRSVSEEL
ncbi:hypothetical protein R4282_02670 [Rhodococcus oxybenzonivorans]|uniref:hypothetical protein n=1 Tax=Rhodococcus oxybenzonivorans TaxID=1990687 RepID=UPI0029546449|nr:hypothetical protein [Rhodococcus oxybenzonivorans]MDV7351921.1 hypothetical protein [Rhodococcus oxybenzonivorans]